MSRLTLVTHLVWETFLSSCSRSLNGFFFFFCAKHTYSNSLTMWKIARDKWLERDKSPLKWEKFVNGKRRVDGDPKPNRHTMNNIVKEKNDRIYICNRLENSDAGALMMRAKHIPVAASERCTHFIFYFFFKRMRNIENTKKEIVSFAEASVDHRRRRSRRHRRRYAAHIPCECV